MSELENKVKEEIKPEKIDFDNIVSVISDPTTEEKAKNLAEGFKIFYQHLQKKYCKDKPANKKKEMGLTEDIFVPDVKPILDEKTAKQIIDEIATHYAKNSDSKIVKSLAKQLEEAKNPESKEKKTPEEIEYIRNNLFMLLGIKQDEIMEKLKNHGISNDLGEELTKRMAGIYMSNKTGPYLSRITDYQKDPLINYLTGKISKFDSTKLKTLNILELKEMLAFYANAKKNYEANKKVIEENKTLSEEEKQAKLKEVTKIFEDSFKPYSNLYKSNN